LDLQLKTISPVLVITLGRYAMNYFYPEGKISRDRGNLVRIKDYYIYPIYHPAAALRSYSVLQEFKADFKKIPEMLIKAEKLIESGDIEKGTNIQDPDGQLILGL
ncbi:MAG: uracil-DNA glycosylase family protein, partial [Patescibacteria group bacterium]